MRCVAACMPPVSKIWPATRAERAAVDHRSGCGARFTPRLDENLTTIAADGKIERPGFTPPLHERTAAAVTPIRDRPSQPTHSARGNRRSSTAGTGRWVRVLDRIGAAGAERGPEVDVSPAARPGPRVLLPSGARPGSDAYPEHWSASRIAVLRCSRSFIFIPAAPLPGSSLRNRELVRPRDLLEETRKSRVVRHYR